MRNAPEKNLTKADFDAAVAVIARVKPPLSAPSPVYESLREYFATLHLALGPTKFSLRFGLRAPCTPLEELELLFFRQQITEEEFKSRFKEYATRPVDRAMLQKFFNEYEAAVEEYGDVLGLIVEIATDQHDPQIWRRREPEVDTAIAKFDEKFDLFGTELMTVAEFLTRVQSDRAELIKCADYQGDSAHWIATLAFSHASQGWKFCKEIAHRSRNDPRYLHATHASALYFKTWIEPNKLPRPNDLATLMRSERAKAIMVFDKQEASARSGNGKLVRTVQPVHFEDFGGHQFERLVFAYHLRADNWRTLEWYGETGSDLGRDIWGERAGGGSLCIQCVNRKSTSATKIKRDLDKIVTARGGTPKAVLVVCASSVPATLRDKVKDHAKKKGIIDCDIWSGAEFEERLRRDAEGLLRRLVDGEAFPDEPEQIRKFVSRINDPYIAANHVAQEAAQTINIVGSKNSGIIANNVTIRNSRSPSKAIILPGSIGADPKKYNYVEYLIKQLTEFREAGASFGQFCNGRVHPGATRKILAVQLGGLPKDLSETQFKVVCDHIKGKINMTALGRRNANRGIANYHEFEEHGGNNKGSTP